MKRQFTDSDGSSEERKLLSEFDPALIFEDALNLK